MCVLGRARTGLAEQDKARLGMARQGAARHGLSFQPVIHSVSGDPGDDSPSGLAWQGESRRG